MHRSLRQHFTSSQTGTGGERYKNRFLENPLLGRVLLPPVTLPLLIAGPVASAGINGQQLRSESAGLLRLEPDRWLRVQWCFPVSIFRRSRCTPRAVFNAGFRLPRPVTDLNCK